MKILSILFIWVIYWGNAPLSIADEIKSQLVGEWKMQKEGEEKWHSARVPGSVHMDLYRNGLIEDPFYRDNERKIQWIGEKNWIYSTEFKVDPKILTKSSINLVFDGLDTYAQVDLNGQTILNADNMHRSWKVPVKSILVKGNNYLRVKFRSVYEVDLPKWDSAPFRLQSFPNNDQAEIQLSLYSRKAGFHFGWDWGPRLITAGIWRPIYFDAWDELKISDLQIFQTDVNAQKADITAKIKIQSAEEQDVIIEISDQNKSYQKSLKNLKSGMTEVVVPFVVENPELWWTNGLGKQPLYSFKVKISNNSGVLSEKMVKTGLRSLKVVRQKDSFGTSFFVELNGVPLFIKGANYIPQDSFQSRVTPERYDFMVRSAAEANMNMLRVWGGGIYENDLFYEMCDKYGILVWQDLMFACGMFPSDEHYLDNVRKEVIENVSRIRNHPSLALINGNNENEISWYQWGWKKLYSPEIQKTYEQDLNKLFYEVIPSALNEVDPSLYYHPSSPIAGFDDRPFGDGDIHYWDVWHGKAPFEKFNTNVGRFMSEYGFQSFPEASSVRKYTNPSDRSLTSDVMLEHQRCRADDRKDKEYGNRLIAEYLVRDYHEPSDFDSYLYVSQLLQAEGVKIAIESHRRNRPYCMGTLYWQINDCWPAASWSSIDYYGKWKALHYFAKKAYAPILISPYEEGNQFSLYLVSDQLNEIDADLEISLMGFDGKIMDLKEMKVVVAPNQSAVYLTHNLNEYLGDRDRREIFLLIRLMAKGRELARDVHYFAKPKELKLPDVDIVRAIERHKNGECSITLKSKMLVKNLFLQTVTGDVHFSDNFFDLLPSELVKIKIDGPKSGNYCKDSNIIVTSLRDSFE